jgi:hypothetical protein
MSENLPLIIAAAPPYLDYYDTFLGIQQFWGPGGPVESGGLISGVKLPKAALLKQKHIEDRKGEITQHLASSLETMA